MIHMDEMTSMLASMTARWMHEDIIDELDDYYVDISIDEDIMNDDVDDDFIINDGIDIDINYDVIDDYHQSMMTSMTMLCVS